MQLPDDIARGYTVYLKSWTLNLRPPMVPPKVLLPPNFIIKGPVSFMHLGSLQCLQTKP